MDLASHYMQMYTTLTMGGTGKSHKKVDERRHGWLMTIYYTNTVGERERDGWVMIERQQEANRKIDGPLHTLRIE